MWYDLRFRKLYTTRNHILCGKPWNGTKRKYPSNMSLMCNIIQLYVSFMNGHIAFFSQLVTFQAKTKARRWEQDNLLSVCCSFCIVWCDVISIFSSCLNLFSGENVESLNYGMKKIITRNSYLSRLIISFNKLFHAL